jgi:bacterial/archaeal transporter family-2 protein
MITMYAAMLASALLVGCLLAVQTSANLQLTKAVGTPYGASTLQLTVAAVLLAGVALLAGELGAIRLDVPTWHLLGGLASPLYITSGILLFPRLGALASVGLFVTGQVIASLALDLFGLLGIPRHPSSAGILLGVLAVLAGITVIIRELRPGRTAVAGIARTGWILLGLIAGAVLPIQGAVNARLRADLHEPLAVALVSFIVATLAIAVLLLVLLATRRTPRPRLAPLNSMPWWGWLGGACAATYVMATFLLIPTIGAATTVALTVTGQQLACALIDHNGLFRLPRRPMSLPRLSGLTLLVAGSVLVQLG